MKASLLFLITFLLLPYLGMTESGDPVHFETLTSQDGGKIGEDLTFSARYGKRLVFHREKGAPLSFSFDEVHEDVLKRLGMDAEAIRNELKEAEEKKQARETERQEQLEKKKEAQIEAMSKHAEYLKKRAEYLQAQADLRRVEEQAMRDRQTDQLMQAAAIATINNSQKPQTIVVNPPAQQQPLYWYYYQPVAPRFPAPQPQPNYGPSLPNQIPANSSFQFNNQFQFRQNPTFNRSPLN